MKVFIYGSNCNVSYQRIEEILKDRIGSGDEVYTIQRYGVDTEVEKYCRNNNINITVLNEKNFKNQGSFEIVTLLRIKEADKQIFICSQIEPPSVNYWLQSTLKIIQETEKIDCCFV